MKLTKARASLLEPLTEAFYCHSMQILLDAGVPFLVGGAYAFGRYTGIERHTKDFDIFVCRRDAERILELLGSAGYRVEMAFPHWLGKAFHGDDFIDVIFGAGNGVAQVDEQWFAHAIEDEVFGVPVRLCPPEEIIWSKSFVQERERYDGADIAHVLRACARTLDWHRLLRRFDGHWRVLLGHLVLFGFIYPAERGLVPAWVMQELVQRLQREVDEPAPADRICRGTLLSREQYLVDVDWWGYGDARLAPGGNMSSRDIAHWTAAIDKRK